MHKEHSEARGGLQQLRLLSVRSLVRAINELRTVSTPEAGAATNVVCVQMFVRPASSRASVVRVQHRHPARAEPRPLLPGA